MQGYSERILQPMQLVGIGSILQQHLHANGHYYCLDHSMKRIYFNIFTNNFSKSITHVGDAKVYTSPKSEVYTPFHPQLPCLHQSYTPVQESGPSHHQVVAKWRDIL